MPAQVTCGSNLCSSLFFEVLGQRGNKLVERVSSGEKIVYKPISGLLLVCMDIYLTGYWKILFDTHGYKIIPDTTTLSLAYYYNTALQKTLDSEIISVLNVQCRATKLIYVVLECKNKQQAHHF